MDFGMKHFVKNTVNNILQVIGVHAAKTTSAIEVQKLIELLKPIDCGIELIRIGSDYDGGYLLPNDLSGIDFCFSPGVADNASFELDCLERGIPSFLADYSVSAPPVELEGCRFFKKFIGAINSERYMTLDSWVTESLKSKHDAELILQMDIEGGEYEALLSTSMETLSRFRILVIEFHNIESIRDRNYFQIVLATFSRLRDEFDVVHIHPNNCCGLTSINGVLIPTVFEVTFLRRDRVKSRLPIKSLPHNLNQPNLPKKADISLPDYWF